MKVRLNHYDTLAQTLADGHSLELHTLASIRQVNGEFHASLQVEDSSKWKTFDTLEEAMVWLTKLE